MALPGLQRNLQLPVSLGRLSPSVVLTLCQMLGYVKRPGRDRGRGRLEWALKKVSDLGRRDRMLMMCFGPKDWCPWFTWKIWSTGKPW